MINWQKSESIVIKTEHGFKIKANKILLKSKICIDFIADDFSLDPSTPPSFISKYTLLFPFSFYEIDLRLLEFALSLRVP